MKPWIKILIGAISGFAGGFAAGFFCHKKLNDIQFEEIDEEEMSKIVSDISEKKETETADKMKTLTGRVNDISAQGKTEQEYTNELHKAIQGKVSYVKADQEAKARFADAWANIKDYSDEENADDLPVYDIDDEDLDEDFLEQLEEETVDPGQVTPPHIITLSEFYNERPEYDKVTIEWYEEDNVYVDERGDLIDDISSYIGFNAGKIFEKTNPDEDPDVRFIRNERYGSDYEIVRHHMSYKEANGEE